MKGWWWALLLLMGCSSVPARDYRPVKWSELACFRYEPSHPPKGKSLSLPQAVSALQGQPLRLMGYMMPMEVDQDKVYSFVLVRDQQLCCFGRMPAMNEWVMVRLPKGQSVAMNMDQPLVVEGLFELGEDVQEGVVISLYRMVGERVTLAEGKPKGWKAN